ncbi:thiamine pyrophosphate-dependent dehydrogenase E1 component subunit alpha [Marinobacter zhanjiangensis]|uniref:2-oxoisovalerate dehydrogenase subunit alpha n=1 Tax=Marinobacter zhanjiangensis TaxID=578215 RepID=A0ABQ3AWR4_9GAMM|nr:thiamine pyrophosphate-dependent dehydrogenase E1 component subunit alpha [Marinobacter zhanjiangensis]GGY69748.1 pyruvate dehydrogenase E1 component subunit alpha [Marinobacter zhanjiangensis]
MKQRHNFTVVSSRYLDEAGLPLDALPELASDSARLLDAYRNMVLARTLDQKIIALQRTGKCGTYPSVLGHEVIGTAVGQGMGHHDVFVPYYRDQATQLIRGVTIVDLLLYWGGDERGSAGWERCPQDLPVAVPIATQCCHAVGIAAAMRIRDEKRAVVVTLGDGASSKGDFLESLNLAGAWHLPVVFVVVNNQWAISTRRGLQTGSETIAQKAISGGLPGHIVDGNDYFAVSEAVDHSLDRAHGGKGASLIEAVTYRLGDHTTADDATRYRSAEELKAAWERDGVKRFQSYLHQAGLWDASQEKDLQAHCKDMVDKAVHVYLETSPEPPTAMVDYLFETLPTALAGQRERLARIRQGGAA